MLRVFQSNRLEILADELARRLRADEASPLAAQTVVVQERALARWLSQALATRLGVAANIVHPFPAEHIWALIRSVLRDVAEESPFDPAVLRWHCMRLLEDSAATRHARLRQALAGGGSLRRYELAQRLAALFDRYLVYRPQWLAAWGAGRELNLGVDEAWQAALWRDLAAALPAALRAHPSLRFFAALAEDAAARTALPRSLHLFAVQALPPMYLDFYAQLARSTDVHLYALNPCAEQWGEIVRRREQALYAAQAADNAELHFETGNSLLASLGRHGRVFFDSLSALESVEASEYCRDAAATLLARLQNDVLDLNEPGADAAALADGDDSVQVHVCHSAMREVEVLHDRLLDAFARDPGLRADEVLVLVPQLDDYAAAIDAVFATAPQRLPYLITQRPAQQDSVLLRSFMQLLRLPEARLRAEGVLALLEEPPIARRQGIAADDLPLLRQWVRETGIRWGYDEKSRAALDLPATREHSWSAGFDRLLLGYALPEQILFDGVLPYADIEGGALQLAGRCKTFVDMLAALTADLESPRSLAEWRAWTERVLARFYACDESEERDAQALRAAAAGIASDAQRADFATPVTAEVWRREINERLERAPRAQLAGGGIVFAPLRPLRAVPARFVAVLGLNDGDYPRNPPQASFDLMARHPLPGDRVPRDEERYALLEALLAARERLYLSYTGRSLRDNAVLPPSPVLAEVLETIRRSATDSERLVVEHPLQPFSPRYFDGSDARLFSYAAEYAHAGAAKLAEPPFICTALPPVSPESIVTLEALQNFLRNPARFFLQERMDLRLGGEEEALEEDEPFKVEGLARWSLRQCTLKHLLEGMDTESSRRIARAAGQLPHGATGDAVHAAVLAEMRPLHAAICAAGALRAEDIELHLGETILRGKLGGMGEGRQLIWHAGRLSAKQLLRAWVTHLAGNAAGFAVPTLLHGLEEHRQFMPVSDAASQLQTILQLLCAGSQAPLAFFPESSLAYMQAQAKGPYAALAAARREWEAREAGDAYAALAFRGREPLDDAFALTAQAIYGPLLEAMRDD